VFLCLTQIIWWLVTTEERRSNERDPNDAAYGKTPRAFRSAAGYVASEILPSYEVVAILI
jgi:hypothetical protein